MREFSFDKIVFVMSMVVLAWLYGFATSAQQWFPNDFLVKAVRQAKALTTSKGPTYLHDRVYDRMGTRIAPSTDLDPGLTIVTSAWTEAGRLLPGMRLIDRDGRVLHEWTIDPAGILGKAPTERRQIDGLDIQGSYLFPDGDVLVNLEYAGTVRLDACGNVRWFLREGSHHSIARGEDGAFWIPGVTLEPRSISPDHPEGFPGLGQPVYQDQILKVREDGTVQTRINVLDLLYANGFAWHLAEEDQLSHDDPTHLNDIEPLPTGMADEYPEFEAGDLLVSLRNLDMVFVFSPSSRRIKWHTTHPLIRQHDPDFLGDGWIGIFDNRSDGTDRGTMLGGSRIVAHQPHTDSMKVLFPTSRSEPFYTEHRGKWEQLDNGNLLLTEEEAGRIVEVDLDGRTVWEWIVEPYDATQVPAVTKGSRVDVKRAELEAWSCTAGTPSGPKEPAMLRP